MKKENRKMAQERRAKERRKKELRRKISKIIVIAIPLIAVIALIIAIIVTSGSADSSTSSGDAAQNHPQEPITAQRIPRKIPMQKTHPVQTTAQIPPLTPQILLSPLRTEIP